jgi:hypothetical protein
MPLVQHGPGRPLINDEAFALSHTRIVYTATPGCHSSNRAKEIDQDGQKAQ